MKKLIIILMFILLSSFCYGAKDPQTITTQDSLLTIKFLDFDAFPTNTEIEFPFHVYNNSNGIALGQNYNINCTMHLYNKLGSHLYINSDTSPSQLYDYELTINNSVITSPGEYTYVIQCVCYNCSEQPLGGFIQYSFYATENGIINEQNYLPIVFTILSVIVLLLMFADNICLHEEAKQWLGYLIRLIALWLFIPLINIAIIINSNGLALVTNTLGGFYNAIMTLLIIITVYYIASLLYLALKKMIGQ